VWSSSFFCERAPKKLKASTIAMLIFKAIHFLI
jgi:hypothetical protein